MNIRDRLERVGWTALSVTLGTLAVELAGVDVWWVALTIPAINWASLWARRKLPALPDPGRGLPGLPT